MQKVLITGANFCNKGAQSMLFVTMDEIKKRFPMAEILFQTTEKYDFSNYCFIPIDIDWHLTGSDIRSLCSRLIRFCKDCIKIVLGRDIVAFEKLKAIKQIRKIDMIIDISGFSLGDKWDEEFNENYIRKIQFAQKHMIPFYVFPQSIGPFNFEKYLSEKKAEDLRKRLGKSLHYPQIIFAREEDGIECLKSIGVESNVVHSPDLVLQNKSVDYKHIFKTTPNLRLININTGRNVGLVPNMQCIRHGNEKTVMSTYINVAKHIIQSGRDLYIIRHSDDDQRLCSKLYEAITVTDIPKAAKDRLHIINHDFSCLEYDYLIKQFDYVVGSRYHGLVHALRHSVPCIALGWAIKYNDLLCSVGLEKYCFDITEKISMENILWAVDDINKNLGENQQKVKIELDSIQRNNCFDRVLGRINGYSS